MWNEEETTEIKEQTTTSLIKPKKPKRFILYDDDKMPILLKKTCEVHVLNYKNFKRILKIEEDEIFNDELGTQISGKQHLNIEETIVPRIIPNRRVPIAIKEILNKELRRLEDI